VALTPREAFKIGFVLRCADEGLSATETSERVEKAAALLEKQAGLWDTTKGIGNLGWNIGVIAPLAVGLGGAYMLHKATEDTVDVEDLRKRELIAEMKHWARRAREQKKMKQLWSS
jgi:hypothetical protein